jgi:FkbM family methyltransferase
MEAINPKPPAGPLTRKLRGFPLRLTFEPRSYIGRFLYYRRMYEDATIDLLRRVLRPGMSFLDVGANIGLYSTIAAHLVGASGRVLAIEPQQDMYDVAQLNARQNGLSNVTFVRTAIGRSAGTAVLHQLYEANPAAATLRLDSGEEAYSSTSVPVSTLSEVVADIDFGTRELVVKIDVEGAELEVLAGAESYFSRRLPIMILVECVDHHLGRFGASSTDVLKKLDSLGYRLSSFHHGRRIELDPTISVDADVIAWRPERSPW